MLVSFCSVIWCGVLLIINVVCDVFNFISVVRVGGLFGCCRVSSIGWLIRWISDRLLLLL